MLFANKKRIEQLIHPRTRRIEAKTMKEGLRCAIFDSEGNVYTGEWKRDKKNGKGVMYTNNYLLCYEGDFKDNKRHGFGTLSIRAKASSTYILIYRGEWREDNRCGSGLRVYIRGGFYEGSFKNDKRHGSGQIWYADGSSYTGNWVDGVRYGKGILIAKNGNRYEGKWKRDQQHGDGKYYFFNRGQLLIGEWRFGICKCGTLVDIPYRAAAVLPSPHPLPQLQLEHDAIFGLNPKSILRIADSGDFNKKSKNEGLNIVFKNVR